MLFLMSTVLSLLHLFSAGYKTNFRMEILIFIFISYLNFTNILPKLRKQMCIFRVFYHQNHPQVYTSLITVTYMDWTELFDTDRKTNIVFVQKKQENSNFFPNTLLKSRVFKNQTKTCCQILHKSSNTTTIIQDLLEC